MARFVTNMERSDCERRFKDKRFPLFQDEKGFGKIENSKIEASVKQSVEAMNSLLSNNTIYMERQPNSENKLYLKLMEKA